MAGHRSVSRNRHLLPEFLPSELPPSDVRGLRQLESLARRSLGVPLTWKGAPDLAVLTERRRHVEELAPFELAARASYSSPDDLAAAHLRYGNALAVRGYARAAGAEYLEAIAARPMLTAAWNDLGSVVRQSWDLDTARWIFDKVAEMDPNDGLAQFNLGIVHDLKGEYRKSDAHYLRALELDPRLWVPALNPLMIGNERASRALHSIYLKRQATGGLQVDTSTSLAPVGGAGGRQ